MAESRRENKSRWRGSSRMFYWLLFYTVGIWFCELADFLCWLADLPQTTLASRLLAAVLTVLFMWKAVGGPEIRREKQAPGSVLFLWAGSLFIFVFFAVKAIQPDMSADTQSYHLAVQIPGFVDNLHYHVNPGRFQMYGFRLAERMFYPFRMLLGLRMGTLLNAAVMLVIYRQTAVFLEQTKTQLTIKNRWFNNASVLAFLIVSRFELLQESGTYMVELIAIPFFLEMVFLLLREPEEARAGREAFVFCLIGGCFFAMKMTNIVYLAPLILLYLWKIRKSVTAPLFAGCLVTGCLPVSIYLFYNGLTTGNPVYPYYNAIFKSPYFPLYDFKDTRWGPSGLKELLLWPYYMVRWPEYRLSEVYSEYNLDLAVCFLAVLGLAAAAAVTVVRKEKLRFYREILLAAVCVSSLFFWTATTGHIRYFMAGLILFGILTACLYLRLTGGSHSCLAGSSHSGRPGSGYLHRVFCLLLIAVFGFSFGWRAGYGYTSVWNGREWSMRVASKETWLQNLPLVFRDREFFTPEAKEKVDTIFLTWGSYGGCARLIGENVPVYSYDGLNYELAPYQEAYYQKLEADMRQGKGVYDMFPQSPQILEAYLAWATESGWYVDDLFYLDSVIKGQQSFTMAGLRMADGRENTWYYGDYVNSQLPLEEPDVNPGAEHQLLQLQKTSDRMSMSALLGDVWYWALPYPFEMAVIASDGETGKVAAVVPLGECAYKREEIILDLSGLGEMVTLRFQSLNEGKQAVVINPKFEEYKEQSEEING